GALDVNIDVDVDVAEAIAGLTAVAAAATAAGAAAKSSTSFWDDFKMEVGQAFDQSTGRIAAFDNLIRGFFTLAITVFLQPLIVAVVGAAGALLGLVSSATFA